MTAFKIQTLNNISERGLSRLPADHYAVSDDADSPDAILLRSFKMHDMDIPSSVVAIGRAGAGTNNIPVDKMSAIGVPVFNAPGANANAVKELVIAGLLMAMRNIPAAMKFAETLDGDDATISKAVESGKKNFVGGELPGRTLGVIGLGAIGVKVANSALSLGMNVIGFDPKISVQSAWQLSSGVRQASSVAELFADSDAVTVHVPLIDATRGLVNAELLASMRPGGVLINLARGGICHDDAVLASLDSGHLSGYVIDFPTGQLLGHDRVIPFPHLGASTDEAEENCAIMVADQVRDYLENGVIRNSVNFPDAVMPRIDQPRITIANANVSGVVGAVSTILADAGHNIADLLNKSKGDVAYMIIDVDGDVAPSTLEQIRQSPDVRSVRYLPVG